MEDDDGGQDGAPGATSLTKMQGSWGRPAPGALVHGVGGDSRGRRGVERRRRDGRGGAELGILDGGPEGDKKGSREQVAVVTVTARGRRSPPLLRWQAKTKNRIRLAAVLGWA